MYPGTKPIHAGTNLEEVILLEYRVDWCFYVVAQIASSSLARSRVTLVDEMLVG